MKKLKRIKEYFSFKKMNEEIRGYGFSYSFKNYLTMLILLEAATVVAGLLYGLKPVYMIPVCIAAFCCIPSLVRAQFEFMDKQKRFNDVDIYIHQMLNSFQRIPKINQALDDTSRVVNGRMRECVIEAAERIRHGRSSTIYEDGLEVVEDEYRTARISTLNKFLVNVEKQGGQYQGALYILQKDFDRWVKRVYKFQAKVKRTRTDILFGIIISFVLGGASAIMAIVFSKSGGADAGINMDITSDITYQISSVIFFIACLVFFTYTQKKYNGDWLDRERTDTQIMKDYDMAFKADISKRRHEALIVCIFFVIIAAIFMLLGGFMVYVGLYILVGAVFILFTPDISRRSAFKRCVNDVHNAFSEWLRDVALNLQQDTLRNSIKSSYDNCPAILKASLAQFIKELDETPGAVEPYYHFLSEFKILEISSTVRTLYGFENIAEDEVDEKINALIEKNLELVDEYEENSSSDRLSVMNFSQKFPLVLVGGKIAIDMLVLIQNYL